MRKSLLTAILSTGAVMMFSAGQLFACPMCWSALTHSPEGARMADGFQSGILLLIMTPFLLAGVIGFRIYKALSSRAGIADSVADRLT